MKAVGDPAQFHLVFVAIMTIIAAAQDHDGARVLDREGVALAQQGKLSDAVDRFRTALTLDPESADAVYHLALAYDRLGNTDQAILEYERALRLHPEFTEARYLMAGCCRKRGDFEGELRLLAAVTDQAPDFAEAHYNYGLALQRDLKSAEAVEQLRKAAALDPKNQRFVLALGVALADRDKAEAVRVLRRAVELDAADADAHYNLALALATAGDEAAAVLEFESAIKLKPDHADAERGLGIAWMHLDKCSCRSSIFELRWNSRLAMPRPRITWASSSFGEKN